MLDMLFSIWVFVHLSLHKSVAGNRDSQSQNEKYTYMLSIINSLEILVGKAPMDMTSHRLCDNGGKEINFTFCLGTTYDLSSMEDIGNS